MALADQGEEAFHLGGAVRSGLGLLAGLAADRMGALTGGLQLPGLM